MVVLRYKHYFGIEISQEKRKTPLNRFSLVLMKNRCALFEKIMTDELRANLIHHRFKLFSVFFSKKSPIQDRLLVLLKKQTI